MKRYFLLATIVALLGLLAGCALYYKVKGIPELDQEISELSSPKRILLTEANTVVLKGPITRVVAMTVSMALMYKSNHLPDGEPIYLVLKTPGGEIEAGLKIIETARSLNREVKTLTIEAQSMGFLIAQHLGERLILSSGKLMTHQPTIYVSGMVRSSFIESLQRNMKLVELVELQAAKRIGLHTRDYYKLVEIEFFAYGDEAIERNMADTLVYAECDQTLLKGTVSELLNDEEGNQFLGVYNACPLLHELIDIRPIQTTNQ